MTDDNPVQDETSLADDLNAAFDENIQDTDDVVVDNTADSEGGDQESTDEQLIAEGAEWDLEVEAPEHWSEADRQEFLDIQQAEDSRDAQIRAYNFLERRYKEMDSGVNKRFQENASNTRIAESVKEVFSPFREELALSGADEVAAIRQMAATHGVLKRDPVNGLLNVMSSYGVNPADAIRTIAERANINPVDIDVQRQNPETAAIMQKLNETQQQLAAVQGQAATSQETALNQEIAAFADAKDQDGNLLHPRFDELSGAMVAEIKAGLATDVASAYKRAEALNPPTERKPMVRKTVKQAKRAAAGVKSSKGEHEVTPRTLREELEAQFERQGI